MVMFEESDKPENKMNGLFGLAAVGIILYHLFPATFQSGLNGIDILFVVSGYQSMCILSQSGTALTDRINKFGLQRVIKLVLQYYTVIILCLISMLFLPIEFIYCNEISLIKTSLFSSNLDYKFKNANGSGCNPLMSSNFDMFQHMWPACIEFQFSYVLPLITVFSAQKWNTGFIFIGGMTVVSFIYSIISKNAYESLFGRSWQFLIGILIHFIKDNYEKVSENISEKQPLTFSESSYGTQNIQENELYIAINSERGDYCIRLVNYKNFLTETIGALFALLAVILIVIRIEPAIIQQIGTVLVTGALMATSIVKETFVLSFPPLTYIGERFVLIYLLYWPAHVLYSHFGWNHGSISDKISELFTIFLLAIIINYFIQKHFDYYSEVKLCLITTFACILCIFVSFNLRTVYGIFH